MNVNYKMMGVVLCGAMLLASGCGAKAETTASSAVESESVSVVALEAASSEAVPESEAVSETVSEGFFCGKRGGIGETGRIQGRVEGRIQGRDRGKI